MTSRERLLALLQRKPLDRVPINTYELSDFGFMNWTLEEASYRKLMKEITERTDTLALWGGSMPASPQEIPPDVEQWQEGEFSVTRVTIHTPKGELSYVTKSTPTVKTTWTVEHLLKNEDDIAKYLSMPFYPMPINTSKFAALDAEIGDSGLVLCDTGDAIGWVAGMFEMGEFTIFAMTQPELIRALCEKKHEEVMHYLRGMLEAGCGPIYRIWGPEYCTPPYLPPSAFREFVLPYLHDMVDLIHKYGCYARVHSHGKIAQVLDMIVESGADATDPVEPPPDGDISLSEIKERYGDKLILFGNMELKYLEQETPAEIRQRVREIMEEGKPGGGMVLMPTAAPINVPLSPRTEENYLAFIEAGHEFGGY